MRNSSIFPTHFSQKCVYQYQLHGTFISLVLEKESTFPPSEAFFFFPYVKRENKGHVSFRRYISAALGNLCPLTEAEMILLACHPHQLSPARESGISLYLEAAGCFHKPTSFPDFQTSTGHKNPREINQWTHYWKHLNAAASNIWSFGCFSFGDRGCQKRLCLISNFSNFHL